MGSSSTKHKPQIIAKCKAPSYCLRVVGSRHVLLGGGGGASKTGVANEIETMLLTYGRLQQYGSDKLLENISLKAIRTNSIDTSPHATMNMDIIAIASPIHGKYLVATGHDQFCDIYESVGFSLKQSNDSIQQNLLNINFKKIARLETDFNKSGAAYQKVVRFEKASQLSSQTPRKLFTGGADGVIRAWRIDSLLEKKEADHTAIYSINAHDGDVNDLDVSFDGRVLISVGQDAKVVLWDSIDGSKLMTLKIPESLGNRYRVRSARFTPLGSANIIFVASYNQIVRSTSSVSHLTLWAYNRERNACTVIVLNEACKEPICAMAISRCGTYTSIGTISGSVGIFDTHEMKCLYFARETHSIFVTDIDFLPRHAVDFASFREAKKNNPVSGVAGHYRAAVISLSADQSVQLHLLPHTQTSFISFLPKLSIVSAFLYYLLWYYSGSSISA